MAGAISLYAGTGIHLIRNQLHAACGMTEHLSDLLRELMI